jgi:hypothetical protein
MYGRYVREKESYRVTDQVKAGSRIQVLLPNLHDRAPMNSAVTFLTCLCQGLVWRHQVKIRVAEVLLNMMCLQNQENALYVYC